MNKLGKFSMPQIVFIQNTLMCHVKMEHQNKKPYVCGHRKLSYFQKQSLIIHLRSKHTGETPYKCDICMKSFIKK